MLTCGLDERRERGHGELGGGGYADAKVWFNITSKQRDCDLKGGESLSYHSCKLNADVSAIEEVTCVSLSMSHRTLPFTLPYELEAALGITVSSGKLVSQSPFNMSACLSLRRRSLELFALCSKMLLTSLRKAWLG